MKRWPKEIRVYADDDGYLMVQPEGASLSGTRTYVLVETPKKRKRRKAKR